MTQKAKSSPLILGHILALGTMIVWGATFSSTKALLADFLASKILLFRFCIAFLLLLFLRPQTLVFRGLRAEGLLMLAGLSGGCLYFLLENVALYFTSASNACVLVAINPIFTGILGFFLFKKPIKWTFLLGFVIASVGIVFVVFRGDFSLTLSPLGDLLCLLAGLVWSFYTLILDKVFELFKGQSPLLITRKVFFYGILFTLPFALFGIFARGDFPLHRFVEIPNLLNLLFLGLVASALCYLSWNASMKILGIYRASAYIYSVPLFGILSAVLALGEPLDRFIVIGGILIVLGLLLSQK
ncbi:DMT family transporter [Helicobacter sp. MIT 21-1697]|uniref:DMT family transporter n=1 Tax=Helicobacter sp. MIT 21-1697 TaxID=2993733 RepID=UPI00224A7F03|nr:DMT family transporter [Helicobacter sp. MIT 21-1697]MCX2717458.1 DMT family transporter [Helicobacter sp. MIT 21-1697]